MRFFSKKNFNIGSKASCTFRKLDILLGKFNRIQKNWTRLGRRAEAGLGTVDKINYVEQRWNFGSRESKMKSLMARRVAVLFNLWRNKSYLAIKKWGKRENFALCWWVAVLALRESVKINIKVLKSVFTFFRANDIDSRALSEFERSMFFAGKKYLQNFQGTRILPPKNSNIYARTY